jgi:hypothetical protein
MPALRAPTLLMIELVDVGGIDWSTRGLRVVGCLNTSNLLGGLSLCQSSIALSTPPL